MSEEEYKVVAIGMIAALLQLVDVLERSIDKSPRTAELRRMAKVQANLQAPEM